MSLPGFISCVPPAGPARPAGGRRQADPPLLVRPQYAWAVYGNHCGPGHGDPAKPGIDAVDEACKAHDACYGSRGYFDCGCDRELISRLPGAITATPGTQGKAAGGAILGYFSATGCVCRKQVCVPWFGGSRCTTVTIPGRGGVGAC